MIKSEFIHLDMFSIWKSCDINGNRAANFSKTYNWQGNFFKNLIHSFILNLQETQSSLETDHPIVAMVDSNTQTEEYQV